MFVFFIGRVHETCLVHEQYMEHRRVFEYLNVFIFVTHSNVFGLRSEDVNEDVILFLNYRLPRKG